jgi:hypothetical protein
MLTRDIIAESESFIVTLLLSAPSQEQESQNLHTYLSSNLEEEGVVMRCGKA